MIQKITFITDGDLLLNKYVYRKISIEAEMQNWVIVTWACWLEWIVLVWLSIIKSVLEGRNYDYIYLIDHQL